MARENRVSQSTISNLENGKPFDVLEIDFYMKLYGIVSEARFLRLWGNGRLSTQELSMQQSMADQYPLFAAAQLIPQVAAIDTRVEEERRLA